MLYQNLWTAKNSNSIVVFYFNMYSHNCRYIVFFQEKYYIKATPSLKCGHGVFKVSNNQSKFTKFLCVTFETSLKCSISIRFLETLQANWGASCCNHIPLICLSKLLGVVTHPLQNEWFDLVIIPGDR